MNKLYVVEGIHDEDKLHKIDPLINTYSIGGYGLNEDDFLFLAQASKNCQIVLLFDPDAAGTNFFNKISARIPNCQCIYLNQADALAKNSHKIGVEHVEINCLKSYLDYQATEIKIKSITFDDLYQLGLTTTVNSAQKRANISKILHLGNPNTKQFLNRINIIGCSIEKLRTLVLSND
jgi:ribonuclease M5